MEYRAVFYQLRYIILTCVFCTLCMCARSALFRFIQPSVYHVAYDTLLSLDTQKNINDYLSSYEWSGCARCVDDILSHFSCIESAEIVLQPSGVAYVDISTKEPRFIVNDSLVLTYNDTLEKKECFSPSVHQRPSIYIHDISPTINQKVLAALNQCEYELYNQFTFEWVDSDHIYFHDKNNELWDVLCSFDSLITNDFVSYYQMIIEQRNAQEAHCVDIRFADQIIVYQNKEALYG